ncbi:MAG: RNA methyltransferase [Planctomycetota bacterium]|nr:MAG: RNA methyltransferase [Planctomycetota bacterium]
MPSTYDVACTLGLEEVVAEELRELGVTAPRTRRGGVLFEGTPAQGYAANLWLRSAVRVTEHLIDAQVRSDEELYELCRGMPWENWMSVEQTLAVDGSVRDAAVTHSGYVALRVKDAIVDRFRDLFGDRPSVDTKKPDLPLKLVWHRDRALVSRDLSGASLHKRGWRPVQVKSPLNEATAAGLLRLANWQVDQPLVDPLCGSGTILIEAAQRAADIAPGLNRRFAFENWPDTQHDVWDTLRADARERVKSSIDVQLAGADRHNGAIAMARQSAQAAGVAGMIGFQHCELSEYAPGFVPDQVVTNPPWGQRIGEGEDLEDTWRELGNFLKRTLKGGRAWVLSGDKELTRHLRMKADRRCPVKTGPIDCRLLGYEVRGRSGASAWGKAPSE